MSLRLFLVDDEMSAIRRLSAALADVAGAGVVGVAHDGESALAQIKALRPDIVFIDIEMPKLNGIELARALRGCSTAELIFVTALSEWAVEAFQLEAADYILKPVQSDRIAEAVSRARRRMQSRAMLAAGEVKPEPPADDESQWFWIPKGNGRVRVLIKDIVRVEASKDYALIYTASNTFILRITMKELGRRFEGSHIARVHRSSFLNLRTALRADYSGRKISRLHTEDGAIVEVSTRYAPIVQERLLGTRQADVAD